MSGAFVVRVGHVMGGVVSAKGALATCGVCRWLHVGQTPLPCLFCGMPVPGLVPSVTLGHVA